MDLVNIELTFGASFARVFAAPALVIGKTSWSRQDVISKLGLANLAAAARLTVTLKHLGITSVKQLSLLDPTDLYRVHGTGHVQVYVAMCVLEAEGYNVRDWWGWTQKGDAVLRSARVKRRRGAQPMPTEMRQVPA